MSTWYTYDEFFSMSEKERDEADIISTDTQDSDGTYYIVCK